MVQKNAALSPVISGKIYSTSLHLALLVLGAVIIIILSLRLDSPDITSNIQNILSFKEEVVVVVEKPTPAALDNVSVKEVTNTPTKIVDKPTLVHPQQSVANWLAKRYRVTNDAAHTFVSAAYMTAKEFKLDPLLILSVMAIESELNPFAQSPAGAQGLMQVMSNIHRDKFKKLGGPQAALDPVANIRVGTQILKEYVTRTGSVEGGLKMYVGAAASEHDGGYGNKVLAEYNRLKEVSKGKPILDPL